MTGGAAGPAARTDRVLDRIIVAGGLLCAAVGLANMVAWFARATVFLRWGTENPMTFNTALAFAVTGLALASKRPWAALAGGLFDAVLGVMVLAEYALGCDFGFDQLVVKAYITGPDAVPGVMAINTAVCLTLLGTGLLVWGPWRRRRPAALAAAGSVIGVIGAIAAFGYVTGNPTAYGWSDVAAMAFVTALTMLVLAGCLLTAAWRDSRARDAGPPRWLPVPAGTMVLGLVVWLAIAGRAVAEGRISQNAFTSAATVLGLVLAVSAALVVWLAQRTEGRRLEAVAIATRRAETERAARQGEHLLFQFLDAMPVGIFIMLPDGRPYYVNGEAEGIMGQSAVPGTGTDELAEAYRAFRAGTDQLYPAEEMPIVRAALGRPAHVDDVEVHRPDGGVTPLEVWGRPVFGANGEVDYAIAAFADMSERQAKENIIAGQAALLELAYDAIFVRDPDGLITYWNAGAEQIYGFTRAEAVGQPSHALLSTQFPEPLAGIEAAAIQSGRWHGELTHRRADGQPITVESRWAAHRAPSGSLLGFLEINRDITARKEAEREALRRAEEIQTLNATLEQRVWERTVHLKRANEHLAAFTYSMAHDLRTPLRGISGFAEALAEEYGSRLDETGRGYTGRIQAATGHMAAVLDDLLDLSRVSRAEMDLQEVDLSVEVTTICDRLRARDRGRRVRVTVEDGVRVTADRSLIRTVLENLLGNAWKFTAGGGDTTIEFGTTPVGDAPICCYVRDNGAGFDPAFMDKLFNPFQRLHAVTEFPGAGIGLAIVQRIIDRHGGRVWAEGAVDHGATFYFTLHTQDNPMSDGPATLRSAPQNTEAERAVVSPAATGGPQLVSTQGGLGDD